MVRRLSLSLLLAALALPAAAAGLRVVPAQGGEQVEAELGRPFSVRLDYQGEADLARIQFDAWQTDFAVQPGYASRQDSLQSRRVRLTPRRDGELTLPPLQLGPASSGAIPVQVAPARERGLTLAPRWSVSADRVWQRQQILAELVLDSPSGELRLESDELHPPGLSARRLPDRVEQTDDGYRYRFSWLLRAVDPGERRIQPPVLRYIETGVPRRRFHFPLHRIEVQPVPDYIPPTVPVGTLASWRDEQGRDWIEARGVSGSQLLAALERAGLGHHGIDETAGTGGTRSLALVDWRDTDQTWLVYFEPTAGRLTQLSLRAPARLWPWWLAAAVVVLSLLAWQGRNVSTYLRRLTQRHRLLARLAGQTEPQALRQALTRDSTLEAWARAWRRDYHVPDKLNGLLNELAEACYGRGPARRDLPDALRRAIVRSRPRIGRGSP